MNPPASDGTGRCRGIGSGRLALALASSACQGGLGLASQLRSDFRKAESEELDPGRRSP